MLYMCTLHTDTFTWSTSCLEQGSCLRAHGPVFPDSTAEEEKWEESYSSPRKHKDLGEGSSFLSICSAYFTAGEDVAMI